MSDVCILITSEFPYKMQETFLEDEIPFLADAFDQIYVFSLDILSEEKKRPLPANVRSFPIGKISRKNKFRLPAYVLKGLLQPPFFREKTGNPKKFLLKTYISGKSQAEYQIIRKHLKKLLQPEDKVCIYSYWFFDHAMIACRLKKLLQKKGYQVKAFSRGHGYDIYSERNAMNYNPFQKPMIKYLDGVYTCSENGRQYLFRKYGKKLCRGKVMLARLGTLEHGTSMQKDFSKIHFVTCSHLSELKRVSLFAKAFVEFNEQVRSMQEPSESSDSRKSPASANIPDVETFSTPANAPDTENRCSTPANTPDTENRCSTSEKTSECRTPSFLSALAPENIRWTCMGDGVEAGQIKEIIEKAGLQKQVTFTGRIAHDDVMKFYSENEITFFLNVSTTEGVPVSIMEAQSFGIPVIATDVGGTSEIVNEGNGRLLGADLTPEILCEAMLQECREENIRRKQKASRADWEKNSYADALYSRWAAGLAEAL